MVIDRVNSDFCALINTYNYEDYLRGTANTMWLTDYQEGKESMVGHMAGAADDFLQLFP